MPFKSLNVYRENAQFINIDGCRLAWWQHQNSEKPFILFIHGFPSASWDWHYQWQALSADYHLIAMDMLGYGLSDKPAPHAYSLSDQAAYYLKLLEHLGVRQCHILAHDYGDSVAQQLLHLVHSKQTDLQLQSITFLNGGLFSESHRPLMTQTLLKSPMGPLLVRLLKKASLGRSFRRIFGPDTPPSDADIDTLWHLLKVNDGIKAMPYLLQYIDERKHRRNDWLTAMQATTVPLSFINGKFDPISGEHMRQRFIQLLPDSDTFSLPVGHYPQIEAPKDVTRLYQQFLAQLEQ